MSPIHYINCLTLAVDFLEQVAATLPNCSLKLRYLHIVRLYRILIARNYLDPVKFLNILVDAEQHANFIATATDDFQMMLNSISILLTREAERRTEIITRSYSLRCLPARIERISLVKSELSQMLYIFVNKIYALSLQTFSDLATDCCIELDDNFEFI